MVILLKGFTKYFKYHHYFVFLSILCSPGPEAEIQSFLAPRPLGLTLWGRNCSWPGGSGS